MLIKSAQHSFNGHHDNLVPINQFIDMNSLRQSFTDFLASRDGYDLRGFHGPYNLGRHKERIHGEITLSGQYDFKVSL